MECRKSLQACIESLSNDYKDFHFLKEVEEVEGAPTPLEFLRNWLSPNVPVIFKGAINHWPALSKWNFAYLRHILKETKISVAVTPNGYADAVNDDLFVLPEERVMVFPDFLDKLTNPVKSSIFYIQKQNNNLFEEFHCLASDVDSNIPWASEALGKNPDAANFWMGDTRAVTSMHKDHYENLYCVVKGYKEFILLPPIDLPWIPYNKYECAVYCETPDGEFELKRTGNKIPWISVDALNPDYEKYPLYKRVSPIHCTVQEGDVLYLPSLWFHHVRQSHACIAAMFQCRLVHSFIYTSKRGHIDVVFLKERLTSALRRNARVCSKGL